MRKILIGIASIGPLLWGSSVSAQIVAPSSPLSSTEPTAVSAPAPLKQHTKLADIDHQRRLVISPSSDSGQSFVITAIHYGKMDTDFKGNFKVEVTSKSEAGWSPPVLETVEFHDGMGNLKIEAVKQTIQEIKIRIESLNLEASLNYIDRKTVSSNSGTSSESVGTYSSQTTTYSYQPVYSTPDPYEPDPETDPTTTPPVPTPTDSSEPSGSSSNPDQPSSDITHKWGHGDHHWKERRDRDHTDSQSPSDPAQSGDGHKWGRGDHHWQGRPENTSDPIMLDQTQGSDVQRQVWWKHRAGNRRGK